LTFAQKFERAIERYSSEYPQEKVIINYSKKSYRAGEKMFFKCFVMSGSQLSNISTNLYMELLDKNKAAIRQSIFPLYIGTTEGTIDLPANLDEGVYYIRAYTTWMLNYDEAFNYIKPLLIFNPLSARNLKTTPVKLSGSLFPESGILLSNVLSKLVVRLNAEETLPDQWKATLYEKGNNTPIISVDALNKQVALLEFIPYSGKEYFVIVKDLEGNELQLPVPQVKENGISIEVDNQNDQVLYDIHFNDPKITGEGYKLVGIFNDLIALTAKVKNPSGTVSGKFETKDFPNGILNLVLLDPNEKVVCSRLSFVRLQQLQLSEPLLLTDTLNNSPKGFNKWRLPLDTTSWYSYSVQIQDEKLPTFSTSFLSDIYLGSEFKTTVYDPGWYFEQPSQQKARALEALLITLNQDRIPLQNLVEGKFPVIKFWPEKYLNFKGYVLRNEKAVTGKEVELIFKPKFGSVQIAKVKTTSEGAVNLNEMTFRDTMQVFFKNGSGSSKDFKGEFTSLNNFEPLKMNLPSIPFTTVERSKELADNRSFINDNVNTIPEVIPNAKYLEEVTIKYKRKTATELLNDQLSSAPFKSSNEKVFDLINENNKSVSAYTNIIDWLMGKVPGLHATSAKVNMFNKQKGTLGYVAQEGLKLTFRNNPEVVPIYLDEVEVDPGYLSSVSVSEIAMVKVIRGGFYGGKRASQSAIAVYRKTSETISKTPVDNLPFTQLVGYGAAEPFFTPQYNNPELRSIDDKRSILTRQDRIIPEDDGMASINFYNNDITKTYRVLVIGFRPDGIPVLLDKLIRK
jgi:hypothetical protein